MNVGEGVKYQHMGRTYRNFSLTKLPSILPRCLAIAGMLLLTLNGASVVFAQSTSSSYQIQEDFIGPGGLLEGNSNGYSIGGSTAGDTGTGESGSATFRTHSGFNTTDEPRLAFAITNNNVALNNLSTSTTATGTSNFSVLNYTSYGYVVHLTGNPPQSGGYTLAGMSSTGPSQVGVEQFGINLRANTSPITFGADPVQVPSSNFSYGAAATGYATANNYRYGSGEVIAQSTQSSGQTDYTISYIANISGTTAGGSYRAQLRLICVGTY
jgi:hypothetical protein